MDIVPALLSTELPEASELLGEAAELTTRLQFDLMDGELVADESVPLSDFGSFPPELKVELHAMVARPREYLADAARLGIKRFVFHLESCGSLAEAAALADELTVGGFIPVASCWPTAELTPLPGVRYYQIMGVTPGAAGQRALMDTPMRVARLKAELPPEGVVGVDGGVNRGNIAELARAGATRFVVNSAFWSADDRLAALYELKSLAEGGAHGLSHRH